MKFFRMIQATKHISDMAEESQVYFDLGKLVSSQKAIKGHIYKDTIQKYVFYSESLKAYLGSSLTEHNNACKFLAMFTAFSFGVEQRSYYDWKQVRVFAEGLWGSMYETPDIFILKNIPIIDISIQFLKKDMESEERRMQKLRKPCFSSNPKFSVGRAYLAEQINKKLLNPDLPSNPKFSVGRAYLAEQINNIFNDNEIVDEY